MEANLAQWLNILLHPPTSIQKVPDSVSDEEVVLVEPLANGVSASTAAGLRPGDSAVITGAGKIGLGALLCAKVAGAAPVIVIDVIKSRLSLRLYHWRRLREPLILCIAGKI